MLATLNHRLVNWTKMSLPSIFPKRQLQRKSYYLFHMNSLNKISIMSLKRNMGQSRANFMNSNLIIVGGVKSQKCVPSPLNRQLTGESEVGMWREQGRVFQASSDITCEDPEVKENEVVAMGIHICSAACSKRDIWFFHHFYSRLFHHMHILIDLIVPQGLKF